MTDPWEDILGPKEEETKKEKPTEKAKQIEQIKEIEKEESEIVNTKIKSPPAKLIISQSLIKNLYDKSQEELPYCPRKINHYYILSDVPKEISMAMMEGIFFETLCIGAGSDGQAIKDLPRHKKTGEKLTAQVRWERQAMAFKMLAAKHQLAVYPGINTQTVIFKRWNDDVIVRGVLDIFPSTLFWKDKMRAVIGELKSTADVHNTYSDFSWGSPEFMDHLQGDMYHWLVRDIDFGLNPHLLELMTDRLLEAIKSDEIYFIYWVFGKKEPLEDQFKQIERGYLPESDPNRQNEMKERVRKSIASLEMSEMEGWPVRPHKDNCPKCTVSILNGGYCEEYLRNETI